MVGIFSGVESATGRIEHLKPVMSWTKLVILLLFNGDDTSQVIVRDLLQFECVFLGSPYSTN